MWWYIAYVCCCYHCIFHFGDIIRPNCVEFLLVLQSALGHRGMSHRHMCEFDAVINRQSQSFRPQGTRKNLAGKECVVHKFISPIWGINSSPVCECVN